MHAEANYTVSHVTNAPATVTPYRFIMSTGQHAVQLWETHERAERRAEALRIMYGADAVSLTVERGFYPQMVGHGMHLHAIEVVA